MPTNPSSKKASQLLDDQPWMQRPDENTLWYGRFCAYLHLGYDRSARAVYRNERGLTKSQSIPQSWSDAYRDFQWQARAAAYDAWQRQKVFTKGNAADTERVVKLDKTIEKLYARVEKMLANAPEDEKFNGFLLDRFFVALDLMAKQTGGTDGAKNTRRDGVIAETETTTKTVFYLPELDALPEQLLTDLSNDEGGHSDAEQNP